MLLLEKVIIVTGAGGGLGEGIARVCHREGARVVVSDIDGPRATAVAASLERSAVAMHCDVRQDGQLQQLVELAVERFGRVDGLVNNAGISCMKPVLETTSAEWENVLAVNLRAPFLLTQMVSRQMLLQQPPGGSIVNIASVHTHGALPGSFTYDAAKWGLVGMTKSMAIDLAPHGIRVNAVSPGLVATQIWEDVKAAAPTPQQCEEWLFSNIPINRPIESAEVGELVAFLLSDRSGCIVGSNIFADGGMSSQLLSRPPFEFRPVGAS